MSGWPAFKITGCPAVKMNTDVCCDPAPHVGALRPFQVPIFPADVPIVFPFSVTILPVTAHPTLFPLRVESVCGNADPPKARTSKRAMTNLTGCLPRPGKDL